MGLDRRDLTLLLEKTVKRLGVAGAQVSVFDGQEQVDAVAGFANAARGEVVQETTLFQVGSTTKIFNAALVLQLAEAGRLELQAPVTEVLPALRLAARPPAALSVLDLISMRGGLDNGPYADFGPGDDAVARYVDLLNEVPLLAEPGRAFGYSNAGTVIAGRVVERLTGLTWENALRSRILDPAGLRSAAAEPEELPYRSVAVGHAFGKDGEPGAVTRAWAHPRSLAPAGSTLCMSAADLVRFARLLLAGGGEVLSQTALERLQTPHIDCPPILLADKWGAGAFWRRWDGRVVIGHSGTNLSGSSTLLWFPELSAAIATTVNVPRLGYPLTAAVLAEVLPQACGVRPPTPPEPDPGAAGELAAFVGRYGAWGVEHHVALEEGRLKLASISTLGAFEPIRTELRPFAPGSFLAADVAVTGNRGYGLCFMQDGDQPATHFLHGPFLSRRLPD